MPQWALTLPISNPICLTLGGIKKRFGVSLWCINCVRKVRPTKFVPRHAKNSKGGVFLLAKALKSLVELGSN